MEKSTINVPGVEGFAQPRTRRDFFKALAVAGAGAAAGTTLLASEASAQSGNTDVDIANFALTIEYLEAEELYPRALNAGILSGAAFDVIAAIAEHEAAHRDALIGIIRQLGGTPIPKPQFTLPQSIFANQQAFLQAALMQEQTDVGALLGAGPMIQNPVFLEAAGTIAGVEGDHVVALKNLLGIVPPANVAFAQALTKDQVLAAIAPFLGMGSMPATGGPGA
jgi:rubrerythrin